MSNNSLQTTKKGLSGRILSCAATYLQHADELIYSYGSKTFLSGYDLYDPQHDNRGRIDCSTFVILVLSGIPYEDSPYAKGIEHTIRPADWADHGLFDFANLPDRYIEIADRIGRPYLAGPKGLDLKKAEEMGISLDLLASEIQKTGIVKRSVYLADYFQKRGTSFSDPAMAKPGDIVFFQSKGFFTEGEKKYFGKPQINHVGIVSVDTRFMIHSSGRSNSDSAAIYPPAISVDPIFDDRKPVFFSHIGS